MMCNRFVVKLSKSPPIDQVDVVMLKAQWDYSFNMKEVALQQEFAEWDFQGCKKGRIVI